ncbi:NADPH-dependent FMN reductase [Candidatus Kinetoplastidibacterium crithidiae]|uniref:NADPH-dependent FMN reductase n=1 Tax=Candidatus Kinetoplastidibacterium crithidiae TCC036E TaxID=1208918 RepID=M1M5L0_9PROT|nr:NAD(P)H-dependent oxidoreductase [Candidatus Kinetoplastibacterium crithidii]AFZ83174.1 chromate reductase [Candidatus Kinetoplastibacterium crithidii (ex Angomonas deanei ATCC 30255)]AGF47450.1 NADPH-dependent FMN reductase [Candidatus Kinetoplastibacterium crithidii TCC036E]
MTTQKITVAVFIGSLKKDSINFKIAKTAEQISCKDLIFKYIKISDLPLYNEDHEKNFPEKIAELKNEIMNTDSVLFITPEHNKSIPAALKNAIDWISRPYGQNSWKNKKAAIIGGSISKSGTCSAQYHLRQILSSLGVITMPIPELMLHCHDNIFDPELSIINEEYTLNFIKSWVNQYTAWLKKTI